ncbi:MAG TPA: molybdate ABC transporter substrate-binding protein [Thermoanaerobaculia bacterium]
MRQRGLIPACLAAALLAVFPSLLAAAEVRVAVAANFATPLKDIGAEFEKATGHKLLVSSGATGKLSTQIENRAPFDVLLAADAEHPARLEAAKLAVAGSRFTYAVGRLVLWSADPKRVDGEGKVLATDTYAHVAIANPKTAPYGAAAQQALTRLGLWEKVQPKIVQGEDIGQTFQFAVSGAAELAFVALSQVQVPGTAAKGSVWRVPETLYAPIEQQAVLLTSAKDSAAARAFLEFLRGAAAKAIIARYGYGS